MCEYSYDDFYNALDDSGKAILMGINEHITLNYPIYKAVDIKSNNQAEWVLNYRKKPKTGKAICTVQSVDGKLSLRIVFMTSMLHEFLLRKNEYSEKITSTVMKQTICVVDASCRAGGGNVACPYRQFFWVDNRIVLSCPYPWVLFLDLSMNDLKDIKLLLDLQTNHMEQNSKDIKGGTYTEDNIRRCGEVKIDNMETQRLGIDTFVLSDHVNKPARLDKYIKLYHLIPMGEKNGLWFFHSNHAVRGVNLAGKEYAVNEIPEGKYAYVTISDPMTFSASRVWNYICNSLKNNNQKIRGITLDDENTACFARIYIDDGNEFMTMYVPVI